MLYICKSCASSFFTSVTNLSSSGHFATLKLSTLLSYIPKGNSLRPHVGHRRWALMVLIVEFYFRRKTVLNVQIGIQQQRCRIINMKERVVPGHHSTRMLDYIITHMAVFLRWSLIIGFYRRYHPVRGVRDFMIKKIIKVKSHWWFFQSLEFLLWKQLIHLEHWGTTGLCMWPLPVYTVHRP